MFFMCKIVSYIQSLEIKYQHELSYVSALIILPYEQYNAFKLSVSGVDRKLGR